MFRNGTVFVIGAGASFEIGMPTGVQLKKMIRRDLSFKFRDGCIKESGSDVILSSIKESAKLHPKESNFGTNQFIAICRQIADSMPLSISIDNYIDAHREDPAISFCGKLAISNAIMEAEATSLLYIREGQRSLDFEGIEKTWFVKFWKILTEGVSFEGVNSIFDGISIISFNYDRTLEHFLYNCLIGYYRIPHARASEIMNKLEILHPYGTVGALEWQDSEGYKHPYGTSAYPQAIISSALRIKTFTERIDDDLFLNRVKNLMRKSENLIFLGFAYHPQNIDIIGVDDTKFHRIIGTAYEISDINCNEIEVYLRKYFSSGAWNPEFAINNKVTCSSFFDEYSKYIGNNALKSK